MKNFKKLSLIISIFCVAVFLQGCDDNPGGLDFSEAPPPYDTSQAVRDFTLSGGVQVFVIEEGDSPFEVVSQDAILVRYTARTEEGQIFESSYSNRSSANTRVFANLTPNLVATNQCLAVQRRRTQNSLCPPLIEGLRKGLLGMKIGEQRTIVIPPEMGYNNHLFVTNINGIDLRDRTLVYDVELVDI